MLGNAEMVFGDRYVVDRELGRGGMATVHLARDRQTDRLVAIRGLLHPIWRRARPERFRREIAIVPAEPSPHPPIEDAGESGTRSTT
jgi:serine/threonine-protein kinase